MAISQLYIPSIYNTKYALGVSNIIPGPLEWQLSSQKYGSHVLSNKEEPSISVSVLIPVYNNYEYLNQCITSALEQTCKQIEIIIINDGSTDARVNSLLKTFSESDLRIRLITKCNSGYGASMNEGMALARGKYIGILESDDYIDKNMYKRLYAYSGENPDIIKCGAIFFESDLHKQQRVPVTNSWPTVSVFTDKDAYFRGPSLNPIGIYRKEFIEKNNIKFAETPGASFQDIGFHFMSSIMANEIRLIPDCLYYYRRDNPHSSINCNSKADAPIKEYERIYTFLASNNDLYRNNIGYFYLRKFQSYKFTLSRLSKSLMEDFMKNFKTEWNYGIDKNEIDYTLFTDDEIDWICKNLLD